MQNVNKLFAVPIGPRQQSRIRTPLKPTVYVDSEVLTAVTAYTTVFWDGNPPSPVGA
jgi:hypothetical protein